MTGFMRLLQRAEGGALLAEIDDLLPEAVRAAVDMGKTSEITLKIKLMPKAGGKQINLITALTSKIPEPERLSILQYPNDDGELMDNSPSKQGLLEGVRDVTETPIREGRVVEA